MPILIILFLVAAVSPVEWPGPVLDLSARQSVLITAALVLASVSGATVVSGMVARAVRRKPERRAIVAKRYYRWRRFAFYLNVGIMLAALFLVGWGRVVQEHVAVGWSGAEVLAPFAELLVPAPYLLTMMLNWAVYWPAERAFHMGRHSERPFWSLPEFWLYQARQFAIILPPVVLFSTHQTLSRFFPVVTSSVWYQVATPFFAVGLALILPWFIKPLLGLKRLPSGPTRDRLQATADRLGIRFSGLLLWPTRGAMANAMVIGIIPWARYVIFTDRLLDGLDDDEVDAVFGHEVGHARFWHLPYYMFFFSLSALAFGAVALLVARGFEAAGWNPEVPPWLNELAVLPPLVAIGLYLFVVFGWLSRVCERQADLFGSRAVSCDDPACMGHTAETSLVPRGRGLCPTGARTMARALERVMILNGSEAEVSDRTGWRLFWQRFNDWMRAWQHGPMSSRVNYLHRVAETPPLADAHDRRAFQVRLFLAVVLLGFLAGGVAVAGREFWKMML